ncbi:MAG: 5-methyltetrahydropteroyltriglutamate--homocysteine S-methyltransferase [Pseudorhodoplanes sp.]|nr:MAG: 5-methyltetrahydropteroyltriglutamate--homocysteine S-methyltransferase [Pseudorhodoplanes sp.]
MGEPARSDQDRCADARHCSKHLHAPCRAPRWRTPQYRVRDLSGDQGSGALTMPPGLPANVRAETVGSFLRPAALLQARKEFGAGRISAATLHAVEERAIRDIVGLQEELGFRLVTDGEFRRENWWIDFVSAIRGVEIVEGSQATTFDKNYVPRHVRTVDRLVVGEPILTADYRFLAGSTRQAAKVTMPSPTRMHFHGGRRAISAAAYPDIDRFFSDVATIYQAEIAGLEEAGCNHIQIDDPLLTYFLSDRLRAEIIAEGDDPDRRLLTYLELLNRCVEKRRRTTTVAIHLCRGNARSQWMIEGGYDGIAERCFSLLDVDRYLLEFDDPRSGSFEPLRFMPRDKVVVLGLITTKRPQLEDKNAVSRRIEEAMRFVDLDRLAISPQCGFASVVEGNEITASDQRAKLELVVSVARQVWGAA